MAGGLTVATLLVRILPQWSKVFSTEGTIFPGNDPWYHVRRIEFLVANFPVPLSFDPFAAPNGAISLAAPLFDYVVAILSLICGLGSPSTTTIEVVAALAPPLLGAACVPVVFLLARLVHSEMLALVTAATLAVHPGEFLLRTALGFADHHALETLLALCVVYLAVLALRRGGTRWALGGGFCLGAYLMAWGGGAMLVLMMALGVAAEAAAAWLGDRSARRVALAAALWAVGAASVVLPLYSIAHRPSFDLTALAGLALLAAIIAAADRLRRRGAWVPVMTTALTAAVGVVLMSLSPTGAAALNAAIMRFGGSAVSMNVNESRSLLVALSGETLQSVLLRFGPSFYAALLGMGLFAADWRRHRPGAWLLWTWGLGCLVASLAQVRFAYYLGPPLAVFASFAYLPALRLERSPRRWLPSTGGDSPRTVVRPIGLALVAALIVVHSLWAVPKELRELGHMGSGWREATDYLRTSTQLPFAQRDAYLYANSTAPRAAYSVMSWWDQGYWIIRRGQRVPVATPNQWYAGEAAQFLLSPTPEEAMAVARRHRSRYAALSWEMLLIPNVPSMLPAVGEFAPQLARPFIELFYFTDANGEAQSFGGLSPDYYRTAVARLLLFGGKAAVPAGSTTLVTFRHARDSNGNALRQYLGHTTYQSYEAAQAAAQDATNETMIIGTDPFRSCVPLEAWPGAQVVFRSRSSVRVGGRVLPEVTLFRLPGL